MREYDNYKSVPAAVCIKEKEDLFKLAKVVEQGIMIWRFKKIKNLSIMKNVSVTENN